MKKELYRHMSCIMATDNDNCLVPDEPYVEDNSEIARILREIFAVDERSGFPQGEIAYYLSPDGNPQIKEWLMNNLLRARGTSVGPMTEGVTDDMLAEFSRQPNETLDSYRERIYALGMEAKSEIEKSDTKTD